MTFISEPKILDIEGLSISFGDQVVLADVNLHVTMPFTGIIGPNGAGKTTLFNAITGIVTPDRGQVSILGVDTTGAPASRVANLGVRRTFQTPKLVPRLSVLENVLLGMDGGTELRLLAGEIVGWPGSRQRERANRESVRGLLHDLGLERLERERVENLPLPTQKLVEVARGLASKSKLLLLDEPAAGMGRSDVQDLLGPVRAAADAWGCYIVIIEHDIELVADLCSDVYVLDFGRMITHGTASMVLSSPAVMEAYLGVANAED